MGALEPIPLVSAFWTRVSAIWTPVSAISRWGAWGPSPRKTPFGDCVLGVSRGSHSRISTQASAVKGLLGSEFGPAGVFCKHMTSVVDKTFSASTKLIVCKFNYTVAQRSCKL